ncbi:membrane protein [Planctomycetales bacterium]|nr:membrane protein [Planctomycetales bacterium]
MPTGFISPAFAYDVTVNSNYAGNSGVFGNSINGSGDVSSGHGVIASDTPTTDSSNNTVTVKAEVTNSDVYGTRWNGTDTNITNNTVTVTGNGSVSGSVYGGENINSGQSANTVLSGNQVIIDSTAVVAVESKVYGGRAENNTVTNNHVTIKQSNTGAVATTGNIYGGWGSGYSPVISNTVTIQGEGNAGQVYGGFSIDTATDNTVYIGKDSSNNGTYSGTILGSVYGGQSAQSDALRNRVVMSSGTATQSITGGQALGSGNAINNTVSISGGTVTGNIIGGASNSGNAINNTVSISTSGATYQSIYGGMVGGGGDEFTGNTLNLHTSGLTAANVYNFEKLNFYLPATLTANSTVLTVTGTANLTNGAGTNAGSRSSIVNVGIDGASSPLQVGDRLTLIDASAGNLVTNGLNPTANGEGMQGVTLKYEFDLVIDGQKLLAKFGRVGVNEPAKALSEGWLGGLALVTQGADLIAGRGVAEAVRAARGARENVSSGLGLATFGAFSGGYSRYNTGSHVDMSSLSVLAGLSYGADLTPGHLTLGGFFEYGNGSYDTYNSFSTAASVHGVGDLYHLGGGVLGHFDFVDTGPGHLYTEASFRAGGVHNEYSSGDLRDSLGRKAGYDSTSAYYGLHVGTGYVLKVTDKASLYLSGKYFWTRQPGDSVTLTTGDPVKFDDADSHRLRLGGRFSYAANKYVAPYIGGTWEHEFDGKVKAATHGLAIDAPSLRGDTGIGELLTLKPAGTWSLIR